MQLLKVINFATAADVQPWHIWEDTNLVKFLYTRQTSSIFTALFNFFSSQENGILIVLSIPPLHSGQNQIGGYQNIRISIILKSSSSGTFHLSIYILTKNIAMHIFAMSWIEKMDHDSNDSDGILRGSSRISPFL